MGLLFSLHPNTQRGSSGVDGGLPVPQRDAPGMGCTRPGTGQWQSKQEGGPGQGTALFWQLPMNKPGCKQTPRLGTPKEGGGGREGAQCPARGEQQTRRVAVALAFLKQGQAG